MHLNVLSVLSSSSEVETGVSVLSYVAINAFTLHTEY